jgi:hypothetical protein
MPLFPADTRGLKTIDMEVCYWALLFMPLVSLHHLLNVFVQLTNKRGFKPKKINKDYRNNFKHQMSRDERSVATECRRLTRGCTLATSTELQYCVSSAVMRLIRTLPVHLLVTLATSTTKYKRLL